MAIEHLDDIEYGDNEGNASYLLQVKHHLKNEANITDSSKELWDTIKIWSEGTSSGIIPSDTLFFLITTSSEKMGVYRIFS